MRICAKTNVKCKATLVKLKEYGTFIRNYRAGISNIDRQLFCNSHAKGAYISMGVSRSPEHSSILAFRKLGFRKKAACKRLVEQIFRQLVGKALEMDVINGLRNDIARMASAELLAGGTVMFCNESIDEVSRRCEPLRFTICTKDAAELVLGRTAEKHFVLNTA